MDQSIEQIRSHVDVTTIIYNDPSPIADAAGKRTGVQLRLPLAVGTDAKALQPSSADAQPPFVALPGLAYGYKIKVGGQPAYCYFASVPTNTKTAADLSKELQTSIGKTFSSAVWRDVALNSPDGNPVNLRCIRAVGPQKFGGQSVEGRFDLYLYTSATYHVLVGWRARVSAADSVSFFETVEVAMSTIDG